MALFKSGNPALGEKTFTDAPRTAADDTRMTISGTVNKTAFLLLLTIGAGLTTWTWFMRTGNIDMVRGMMIGGSIAGLILCFILIFKKELAPYLAPAYAIVEGLALGGISAVMETIYPGIAMQAMVLTFCILFALLGIYKLGIIKATENFKLIVGAATAGIALFYGVALLMSLFSVQVPLIHSNSGWGILFSLGVVVLASLNLVMDFDFIEEGEKSGAPKYMEWYGAFGLLVTLIWLYIELLRLLAKLQSRD